jgi:hypothetical protein
MGICKALQGSVLAVACAGLSAFVLAPAASAGTVSTTFYGIGEQQTFEVPDGVTSVEVMAVGASGGGGTLGGLGGVVSGNVPVTGGEPLYVEVGGEGCEGTCAKARPFNGGGAVLDGGAAGVGDAGGLTPGASGGGASDIQTSPIGDSSGLSSRLLVAGGGGGAGGGGYCQPPRGGDTEANGGGCIGGEGGGGGATATGGGEEVYGAEAGTLGEGGDGDEGGGGGGGLYGGGAGANFFIIIPAYIEANSGGGGGGSNLIPSGGSFEQNVLGLAPQVTISYVEPPACTTATGRGTYQKRGVPGRLNLRDVLSTNLAEPERLNVNYESGQERFGLKSLTSATCEATATGKIFRGEGTATKRGYTLSFALSEAGGSFSFEATVKKESGETVYEERGPLKTKTEKIG